MKDEKVAIVLCGGGALGSYEAGVWKYLKEIDFKYDLVVGTSIGALNGALMVTQEYEKCLNLWNTISIDQIVTSGVDVDKNFFHDFFSGKNTKKIKEFLSNYIKNKGDTISPFKEMMKKNIDPKKILSSPIEFGIVICTFPDFKEIHIDVKKLKEKEVHSFLHATSAVFPIFPIEKINGKRYVDGGFKNNLPINLALEMGATKVVAVELNCWPRPKISEFEDLPFVTLIAPSWRVRSPLGALDFTQESIQNNFLLGYLDASRAFGSMKGFKYTIEPFDDKYPTVGSFFLTTLVKHSIGNVKEIDKHLLYKKGMKMSSTDYFIRTLELIAESLELDFLRVYTLEEFIEDIFIKVDALKSDPKVVKKYKKLKEKFSLKGVGEKEFIYYLHKTFLNMSQVKIKRLIEVLKKKFTFLLYLILFITLKEFSLGLKKTIKKLENKKK